MGTAIRCSSRCRIAVLCCVVLCVCVCVVITFRFMVHGHAPAETKKRANEGRARPRFLAGGFKIPYALTKLRKRQRSTVGPRTPRNNPIRLIARKTAALWLRENLNIADGSQSFTHDRTTTSESNKKLLTEQIQPNPLLECIVHHTTVHLAKARYSKSEGTLVDLAKKSCESIFLPGILIFYPLSISRFFEHDYH